MARRVTGGTTGATAGATTTAGATAALVDKGNTAIVIEHNLDVIRSADWMIDMGPEGGSGGGMVVAEGTPEQVAKNPASHTGKFLAEIL